MAQNETARATVFLDGKQAQAALEALDNKAKELKKDLNEALQAGDNIKYDKLKKELSGIEGAERSLKREVYDVERVLKNINKVSWRDLERAQRTITSQMKAMERGTEAYIKKAEELKKVRTALAEINAETRATNNSWSFRGLADGLNRYFGIITAGIATLTGMVLGFKQLVKSFNDFEERVDNLSALTGLAGGALDWLKQKAKELSTATLEGGVRVRQGALEIVDAFTKTGSARPELLKNKEALVAVTQDAIILANASKTQLQPAIEALTMVMNQYNAPASQTRRIINAIAAGSKAGAGEIPYITAAFEKAGTVASDAGISIETLVATIETLAPRISQPEIAGRTLKGVLLDLQTGANDTNPAIVGMATAFENLAKKNLNITQLTKMFGVENVTTAKILINNVEELKKYETAVTGTSVAIEQAGINTNNNNARLDQAKNRINIVSMELGEKLAPAMATATGWYGKSLEFLTVMIDFLSKYGGTILAVSATIATYALAVKAAAYWDNIHSGLLVAKSALTAAYRYVVGVLTGQITLATVAQNAWNLAQKLNPIGAVIAILVAAGSALYLYTRKLSAAEIAQKALNDVSNKAKQSISDEKVEMEQLLRVAQNELLSKATRQEAIEKLNKLSPEYLGGLTLETINTEAATIATNKYIASLEKKARVEAASENIKNATAEIGRLKAGEGGDGNWFEIGWNAVKNGMSPGAMLGAGGIVKAEKANARIKELTIQLAEYQKMLDAEIKSIDTDPGTGGKNGTGNEGGGGTGDQLKDNKMVYDALEIAHKYRIMQLTGQYAGEEVLKKEFHARMLSEELAYLEAKRNLEKDPAKAIDLQTQITNKQLEYVAALKAATPEIIKNSAERNNLTTRMADEARMNEQAANAMQKSAKTTAELSEKQDKMAEQMKERIGLISDGIYEMMSGQENAFKDFAKNLIIFELEQLKLKARMAIAGVTIQGLASLNPAAMLAAGAKILAIEAVFAGIEGLVNNAFGGSNKKGNYDTGGYTGDGGKQEPAGIVHRGEYVIPQEGVNNPTIAPILTIFEMARRNKSLAKLDLGSLVRSGSQSGSYSGGGYVPGSSAGSQASPVTIGSDPELKAINKALAEELKHLRLNGITAKVNKFGSNSLSDAMDDIASFNSKVYKK